MFGIRQLTSMEPLSASLHVDEREQAGPLAAPPVSFEVLYRSRVDAVMGFFARRSGDPETVGDLTAETFLEALRSYGSFDPGRGSAEGWLFAVARRVFARHCEEVARRHLADARLAGHRGLDDDAIAELQERIDAEKSARELVARLQTMPQLEREAIELVDLAGLAPRQAARALGISAGALRVRLFRARAQLRKEHRTHV